MALLLTFTISRLSRNVRDLKMQKREAIPGLGDSTCFSSFEDVVEVIIIYKDQSAPL